MLNFDIDNIITSLKSTYGKDFLDTITMQLHKSIGAQFTFIAKLDTERNVSKTMSLVAGDDFTDNFEYSLEHTPCADVSDDSTCIFPSQIVNLYPQDQLLIDMGIDGYIGAPLHDSKGAVFGLVVALYSKPIENAEEVASLFELFAGRISAELERAEKEHALFELNQSLEQKVAYRTFELENAVERLKKSQKQLIEQEKLASLGRLVAGVAHEVNTPLGVAVLGNSTVISGIQALEAKLANGTLSKSDLTTFIADAKEASSGVEFNLNRASELVVNFKQMATDFHSDPKSDVNLAEWLNSIANSLKPMLRGAGIRLNLELPCEKLVVTSYPSRLAQVITNLVSNAIKHAFPETFPIDDKVITIALTGRAFNYSLLVADNGIGMDEQTKSHILDPFFTTGRATGGMGLGMNIVHNLVTGSLNGQLVIESAPNQGTQVRIHFDSSDEDRNLLKSSFSRATLDNYQFYSSFHDKLINSDVKVERLFANVDLARQQTMILQSINLMVENLGNLDAIFHSSDAKIMLKKHHAMGIDDTMLTLWKDCLLATLAEFDSEFDSLVANAWENVLSEYTQYFLAHLQ
ncbi:ATP-binding protein [Pseudoalteromonas sp. SSM20]|uniref:ATP-binding protein n=1 Tax=Pseudoalteromonas sp. SSM20 TaxID=3139394 RepID=UPI003BA96A9F